MKIGSTTLQFFLVEGAVSGVRNDAETMYQEVYSPHARGSFVTSALRTETQYWVKDSNGIDRQVTFGASVPMRDGHWVKAVYASVEGNDDMWPVAVFNESARALVRRGALDTIKLLSISVGAPFGCLGAVVGFVALPVLPMVAYLTFNTEAAASKAILVAVGWLVLLSLRNHFWGKQFLADLENNLQVEIAKALGLDAGIPDDVTVRII